MLPDCMFLSCHVCNQGESTLYRVNPHSIEWIHTLFESSCSHLILDTSLLENVLTGKRVIAWKLCKYVVSWQGVKSEGKVKICIMAPSGAIYAYKKKQR